MYNMYGAHICKYIVNWRNYIKRDLNLKWPNWGSFDILKLIFLCTHLEKASRAYFDWYLEASKRGNGRVTSLQKINKKLLETISKLKRLLALTLPGHRSSGTGKSRLAFMPFGFWFLGVTLPSFWGTPATWLLISGHLFAFCFIWSETPGWWSSGLVWFVALVWVHRHLVQTDWVNTWITHSKVPHSTWESRGGGGETFFFWVVNL